MKRAWTVTPRRWWSLKEWRDAWKLQKAINQPRFQDIAHETALEGWNDHICNGTPLDAAFEKAIQRLKERLKCQ